MPTKGATAKALGNDEVIVIVFPTIVVGDDIKVLLTTCTSVAGIHNGAILNI